MEIFSNSSAQVVMISTTVLLIVLMVTLAIRERRISKARFLEGLIWLQKLRNILSLVQQHRGLSNGYVCGDHSLSLRILPLQTQINLQRMALSNHGTWIANNPDWAAIQEHWQRLSTGFEKLDSNNNLEQHSKLISSILYLIDDCAEQHQLYEVKDQDQRSIRYLWQDLLVTAENVGQARAIGTGVAATGRCTSVNRIRLSYLHQAISNVSQQNHDVRNAALNNLLDLLTQKVIVDSPSVSANDYFDVATLALEEVLVRFDETLAELKQLIASKSFI
ncbi:hypothetical protein DBZ36_01895 [Alginatibacterium sediminis]|uniref:Uncharacterized protein n=1 Tax=Alginatibacterium sediminis TaxID=2164068 RepID=A0A420EL47_9ALTE|nr:nitrate- and nitrite sensing domain-containing protein [Alginatibacterium sediminis]RKF21425.1 hypothetical protein DBZ36_01895 [Alginatibacterium sediminis]